MNDIKEEVYSLLSEDNDIADIVGNRIFPTSLPQDRALTIQDESGQVLKPFILYRITDTQLLKGLSHTQGKIVYVEIDCWHNKVTEVGDLSQLVIDLLDDYSSETVLGIFMQDATDEEEQQQNITPYHQKMSFKIIT